MDIDFETLFILGFFMLVPATIFVVVFTLLRRRRGRFHRQRITKNQKNRNE